jgi:hypothetical protein
MILLFRLGFGVLNARLLSKRAKTFVLTTIEVC